MKERSDLPFVTIIMPIRNEGDFIARSLEAVLEQDYPHECLEIIVVDGMSTDATREIVKRLAEKSEKIPIRLLDNPGMIVPTAMNIGIREARGSVITRVDGHTIVARDYIRQCVAALQASGAENVGGRMNPVSEQPFGRAVSLATSSPFGVGGARFHYSDQEEWVDTVYMGAWSRSVFQRFGMFDEEQVRNQDDEFNYRIREGGGRIFLSSQIKSEYFNRSNPASLWKQYFQYGYWKVRVMQKHPRQMRLRQFIPPIFVLCLLVSGIASLFSALGLVLFIAVLGSYLLANLSASVVTASWKRPELLPRLSMAFAILHVAYGIGFLSGLFRFWNRWGDRANRFPAWDEARKEQTVATAANVL